MNTRPARKPASDAEEKDGLRANAPSVLRHLDRVQIFFAVRSILHSRPPAVHLHTNYAKCALSRAAARSAPPRAAAARPPHVYRPSGRPVTPRAENRRAARADSAQQSPIERPSSFGRAHPLPTWPAIPVSHSLRCHAPHAFLASACRTQLTAPWTLKARTMRCTRWRPRFREVRRSLATWRATHRRTGGRRGGRGRGAAAALRCSRPLRRTIRHRRVSPPRPRRSWTKTLRHQRRSRRRHRWRRRPAAAAAPRAVCRGRRAAARSRGGSG